MEDVLIWDVLLYIASMCCFYWLMNKVALAYGRAEYSKSGNSSKDKGKKKAESGDASNSWGNQDVR